MNGSNGTVIYNSNEMNGQEDDKTYSNRSKPYISDVLMNGLLHNSQPTNFTLVMFFFSLYLFPIFLNCCRSFFVLLFVIPNSHVKFMFFFFRKPKIYNRTKTEVTKWDTRSQRQRV